MANLSGWPFYFYQLLIGGFHMERTLIGPKELAQKLDVPTFVDLFAYQDK